MKKVFISQPMRGKAPEVIEAERAEAIERACDSFDKEEVEVIDTYFKDFDGNAVGYLGKSISKLAEADVAVFCPGWEKARGCEMEYRVATAYGIDTLQLGPLGNGVPGVLLADGSRRGEVTCACTGEEPRKIETGCQRSYATPEEIREMFGGTALCQQ